ncbi:MAG: Asp23/Gls24 family envelope stress response protein [Thermoleophilaceae bacterium]|nr:Asp23/Gls24 family envelope stress response protein [Thermoleophilaceae bacterium]
MTESIQTTSPPKAKNAQGVPVRTGDARPAVTRRAAVEGERGKTRIADVVVAKIAGLAAREIPGVHSMGRGIARALGVLRAHVPGASEASVATQGVSVEVGEREAAIDLDIVTWYGQSIIEIADAVRRNVIDRVEGMTGLQAVEVNITVDDIHVEGEEEPPKEARVQ